jgi:TolB protein
LPAWSPDGSRIVFSSDRDTRDNDIYVMPADGGGEVALTHNDVDDHSPSWSPDGRRIVFVRDAEDAGVEDI